MIDIGRLVYNSILAFIVIIPIACTILMFCVPQIEYEMVTQLYTLTIDDTTSLQYKFGVFLLEWGWLPIALGVSKYEETK